MGTRALVTLSFEFPESMVNRFEPFVHARFQRSETAIVRIETAIDVVEAPIVRGKVFVYPVEPLVVRVKPLIVRVKPKFDGFAEVD